MFTFISENWEIIAIAVVAIYEVIARQIPTTGNWSILHAAIKILDIIVKNKAKSSETDETGLPKKKLFKLKKSE